MQNVLPHRSHWNDNDFTNCQVGPMLAHNRAVQYMHSPNVVPQTDLNGHTISGVNNLWEISIPLSTAITIQSDATGFIQ